MQCHPQKVQESVLLLMVNHLYKVQITRGQAMSAEGPLGLYLGFWVFTLWLSVRITFVHFRS